MSRRLRLEFVGGLYHVMFRGNRRQAIFLDDDDRRFLLARLRRLKARLDVEIYAFTLMPNHVHLVLRRMHDPVERFMAALLTAFARHFNRKYDLVGHVFQGRYHCLVCEDETYLLRLVRYVHRNALRAGITPGLGFPWSSYSAYLTDEPDPLVDREPVLSMFGAEMEAAQEAFREFHEGEEAAADSREDLIPRRGTILGGARFESRARRRAAKSAEPPAKSRPGLDQILRDTLRRARLRVDPIEVRGSSRRHVAALARSLFVEVAVDDHGYCYAEIAGFLGRAPAALRVMLCKRRTARERSVPLSQCEPSPPA